VPYEGARTASAIESFALEQFEMIVSLLEVVEITSPGVLETKCSSVAICFVSSLPDILDTRAVGKQPALERAVGVSGCGYAAVIA